MNPGPGVNRKPIMQIQMSRLDKSSSQDIKCIPFNQAKAKSESESCLKEREGKIKNQLGPNKDHHSMPWLDRNARITGYRQQSQGLKIIIHTEP